MKFRPAPMLPIGTPGDPKRHLKCSKSVKMLLPGGSWERTPLKAPEKELTWTAGYAIRSRLCSPNTVCRFQISPHFGSILLPIWHRVWHPFSESASKNTSDKTTEKSIQKSATKLPKSSAKVTSKIPLFAPFWELGDHQGGQGCPGRPPSSKKSPKA